MWFLYLLIPLAASIGLNNCSQRNQVNQGTSAASYTFQAFSGSGQTIPRRSTSSILIARLIEQSGNRLVPVPNVTVHFSVNGAGTFLYNDIATDSTGVVRTFFSSVDSLGTFTVTATTSTGLTAQYSISVADYSPTSVTLSSTNSLEYVFPSHFACPNSTSEEALVSSVVGSLDSTHALGLSGSSLANQVSEVALSAVPAVTENIANPTDTININIQTVFPSPVSGGTCSSDYDNIPPLLFMACDPITGMTFNRSLMNYSGTVGVSVTSAGASVLDVTSSNKLPIVGDGLIEISNINTATDDIAQGFTAFQSAVYFAENKAGFTKLFKHVGNTMFQISNINSTGDDKISNLVSTVSYLYFIGANTTGTKLYRYNGTAINQISNIKSGGDDQIAGLIQVNGNLFFSANNGSGAKIYEYNVSSNNITQISNLNPGGDDGIVSLFSANNNLYFSSSVSGFSKLYEYNGTVISQISNVQNGGNDNPQQVIAYNGNVYFSAEISPAVSKLFMDNGTSVSQVLDILGSSNDDAIGNLAVYNSNLYFSANNPTIPGVKLYQFNGSQAVQISSLNSGGTDDPSYLTVYAGSLFFRGTADGGNYHIFRYDGTKIVQASQILGPGEHDNPKFLGTAFSGLYFIGNNPNDAFLRIFRFCSNNTSCLF
jgi:hypothetical protein